jgi:hypothetical protein
MEIKEIVNYFLNSDKNILEVTFRTIEDNEEDVRVDNIDYSLVEEYGYELETESFSFFDEEDEENEFYDEEKVELDEDELVSFLNEYYEVNPNSMPKSEPY